MKIELKNNKIFFENQGQKKEIHPFWLRERVNGENFIDEATQQRLFDPTKLEEDIKINSLNLSDQFLEITFNDGAYTKFAVQNILREFSNEDEIKKQILLIKDEIPVSNKAQRMIELKNWLDNISYN